MTNEMNLMKMDERQRLIWFMANRGTLITVGAVWIGMIGWELTHGRVPTFLAIMMPVFAIIRAGLYFLYKSQPHAESDSAGKMSLIRYGKAGATGLLLVAAMLPIYSVAGLVGEPTRSTYVWEIVSADIAAGVPLAIIFLWPLFVFLLSRLKPKGILPALIHYAVPFLAVASSIMVLWIPQLIFETRILFYFLIVPVNPVPAWGCYLAVIANGLHLVSWLAGQLRPWDVQEC